MVKNKKHYYTLLTPLSGDNTTEVNKDYGTPELGTLEITGTGEIRIWNTGGSSASEGGMGSDSDDSKAKGDLTKPADGKGGNLSSGDDDSDITFDPIKKNVRKAEKEQDKD